MHEVLVNLLGGLSLPRKSVVRLTDCPDMTLDVYRGHKTAIQQQYKGYGYTRVATVSEKYLENEIFSRSGKSQGILLMAREI